MADAASKPEKPDWNKPRAIATITGVAMVCVTAVVLVVLIIAFERLPTDSLPCIMWGGVIGLFIAFGVIGALSYCALKETQK